jgi:hypothetical protein
LPGSLNGLFLPELKIVFWRLKTFSCCYIPCGWHCWVELQKLRLVWCQAQLVSLIVGLVFVMALAACRCLQIMDLCWTVGCVM